MHVLPGILVALVGILVCFFGYRLLRLTLIITGFALGGYLGFFIASRFTGPGWLTVLSVIGLGVLGAVLTGFLFKLGVFVLGAVAAGLLVLVFAPGTGWQEVIFVLGIGLAGGVLALFLQRPVIAFLSAFLGAWWVVAGLFHLGGRTHLRLPAETDLPMMGLSWLVLGIVGFLVQVFASGKKKDKQE